MAAVCESSVPQRIFLSLEADACKVLSGFPGGAVALSPLCYILQQLSGVGGKHRDVHSLQSLGQAAKMLAYKNIKNKTKNTHCKSTI